MEDISFRHLKAYCFSSALFILSWLATIALIDDLKLVYPWRIV